MTGLCACKRGFFTLRECRQPAASTCQTCGRPVCQEHLSLQTGMQSCVECAAQQGQATALQKGGGPGYSTYDRDWAYGYRRQYYSDADYSPVMLDNPGDSSFNSYDSRSFDSDLVESGGPDGDDGPDFADS